MSAVWSPAARAQALRRFRLAKVVARPDSAAQPRSSEAVARRARRTHTAVERTRHINTLSLRFKLSRPHIIAREHREEEHTHKNKLHAQQASPHEDVNCSTDIFIRSISAPQLETNLEECMWIALPKHFARLSIYFISVNVM